MTTIDIATAIRILGGKRAEALALLAERDPKVQSVRSHHQTVAASSSVRLRDVLRAWERGRTHSARQVAALVDRLGVPGDWAPPYTPSWWGHSRQPGLHETDNKWVPKIRRHLHQLISIYGPDTPVSEVIEAIARERADRTDHRVGKDAPVSDGSHTVADADSHGGDGNSGEMDHAAETTSDGRASDSVRDMTDATGDTPDGQSAGGSGPDGPNSGASGSASTDSSAREGEGQPTGRGGMMGGDEPAQGIGSHRGNAQTVGNDGTAGDSVPAQTNGTGDVADIDGEAEARSAAGEPQSHAGGVAGAAGAVDAGDGDSVAQGDAGSPHAGTDSYGGSNLDDTAANIALVQAKRDARRVIHAIERIVERACGIDDRVSRRWNAVRLAVEIQSRRCAVHRARKRDCEIRDLVITVDESESCAETVDATYAAALVIAGRMGRRASVIVHSNGYCVRIPDGVPCAAWLRREIDRRSRKLGRDYYAASQRAASDEVWDAIASRRPGLVLAIGDLDAHEQFDSLARRGVRVLLLSHDRPVVQVRYDIIPDVVDLSSAARGLAGYGRITKQ